MFTESTRKWLHNDSLASAAALAPRTHHHGPAGETTVDYDRLNTMIALQGSVRLTLIAVGNGNCASDAQASAFCVPPITSSSSGFEYSSEIDPGSGAATSVGNDSYRLLFLTFSVYPRAP